MRALNGLAAIMLILCLIHEAAHAQSRGQFRITGSSSVFPFSTAVAEEFGRTSRYRAPIVEGIGTGGGLKLFCAGPGSNTPSIVNASRPIKPSELALCATNGVSDIVEVKFGYDGIVIANNKAAAPLRLSLGDIYLAIAAYVPSRSADDFRLIPNPYRRWNQINPALPDQPITVLGPPPTSGTRDALNETVMAKGCNIFPEIAALEEGDPYEHQRICQAIREDGIYVESGENDNLIVQKLQANDQAVGIFAFSYLDQNNDVLQPAMISIDGDAYSEPTFDAIADGSYPIFRSLFFYVKKAHVGAVPGIHEFLVEFTSENASGEFGYLTDRGLIPLEDTERARYAEVVSSLATIPMP